MSFPEQLVGAAGGSAVTREVVLTSREGEPKGLALLMLAVTVAWVTDTDDDGLLASVGGACASAEITAHRHIAMHSIAPE